MTSEDTGAYGRDIGVTLPDLLNEVQSNIDLRSRYDFHPLVGGGVMSLRPSSARTLRKDAGT